MTQHTPTWTSRQSIKELAFYSSSPHDCGYLPNQSSVTLFADPGAEMDGATYSKLVNIGFRRSGAYVYKPYCQDCQACIAARIPVNVFRPNRTQRRNWQRNTREASGIVATIMDPGMREEQFALYRKYISTRHAGGGMDDPSPNRYMEFLTNSWTPTEFVEFRLHDQLIAVAVMDVLSDGLSSVYTFFDPDHSHISPGRYVLLWQINEARRRQLSYVYLGYWIKDCQKMLYKQEYRPIELFIDGRWHRYDRQQELPTQHTQKHRSSGS
ncbi:arginyltransferase [Kaarinaea lacus]